MSLGGGLEESHFWQYLLKIGYDAVIFYNGSFNLFTTN